MHFAIGLAAALAAAVLFNVGVALQALEARKSPKSLGLKVGLIGHLLKRPFWLLGIALEVIGIAPQLVALAYAPFAVVQTALTAGLVLLLLIGARYLGERVDRAAMFGVALLIVGVSLVSWGSPEHSEHHRAAYSLLAVVGVLSLGAISPFLLRGFGRNGLYLALASGVGFAGTNVATKLASDDVGVGHWANAIAWGVVAGALGICATVTGMSAFQQVAATVVVPMSTAVQTFLPIVLEPLFLRERFHSFATGVLPIAVGVLVAAVGVVLVGRAPAVGELASGG